MSSILLPVYMMYSTGLRQRQISFSAGVANRYRTLPGAVHLVTGEIPATNIADHHNVGEFIASAPEERHKGIYISTLNRLN